MTLYPVECCTCGNIEMSLHPDGTAHLTVEGKAKLVTPSRRDWEAWRRLIYLLNEVT